MRVDKDSNEWIVEREESLSSKFREDMCLVKESKDLRIEVSLIDGFRRAFV